MATVVAVSLPTFFQFVCLFVCLFFFGEANKIKRHSARSSSISSVFSAGPVSNVIIVLFLAGSF